MGQGNYIPDYCEDYRGFFVDYNAIYDVLWDDVDVKDMYYNDFINNLKSAMIKKFCSLFDTANYDQKYSNCRYRRNNERVILDNELCQIITTDNQTTLAIFLFFLGIHILFRILAIFQTFHHNTSPYLIIVHLMNLFAFQGNHTFFLAFS